MPADIVFDATYPHPPDLVWRAIASPDGFRAWLMENDFREATAGHRFRFTDRPRPFWDGICNCEVAEADAPKKLAIRWGIKPEGGSASLVSWTLTTPPGGGTHVQFRHSGLSGVMGWVMKKGMTRGWQRMMERSIPFVLEGLAKGQLPSRDDVKRELQNKRC